MGRVTPCFQKLSSKFQNFLTTTGRKRDNRNTLLPNAKSAFAQGRDFNAYVTKFTNQVILVISAIARSSRARSLALPHGPGGLRCSGAIARQPPRSSPELSYRDCDRRKRCCGSRCEDHDNERRYGRREPQRDQ